MPESANRQWLRLANHINRFPGSPDFGNPDFRSQQNDSSAAEPVFGAIRHASASVLGPEMGRRPARPRRRRNRAPFTGIRPEIGLRGNRGRTSRFFRKSGFREIRISSKNPDESARRARRQFLAPFALLAPRFWGPKWVSGRLGPDVAEIGPLLPGFGPKPGCAEIAAERPDFF